MRKQSEALARKKSFLLCRIGLIFFTTVVGVLHCPSDWTRSIVLLGTLAVASNVYAQFLDPFDFFDNFTQSVFMMVDTATVFMILLTSATGTSFFIPFFLVLILTAKFDNVIVLIISATLLGLLSEVFSEHNFGMAASLSRVPFLVMTAIYYWFIVLPDRKPEPQRVVRVEQPTV